MEYKHLKFIEIMEKISLITKNPFIAPQIKKNLIENLQKELNNVNGSNDND